MGGISHILFQETGRFRTERGAGRAPNAGGANGVPAGLVHFVGQIHRGLSSLAAIQPADLAEVVNRYARLMANLSSLFKSGQSRMIAPLPIQITVQIVRVAICTVPSMP